jgi:transposase
VQRFVKALKPIVADDPVVRFETAPGEQLQLDWIEFRKRRGDLLAAFVATLGWSRASFVRFVDNERVETLIDCVKAACEFFQGVPRTILADNVKTIVDRRNAYGKGMHRWHPAFWDLAQSCGFTIRLCAPYRARTKGKVERMNGYLRRSFYVPLAARLKPLGIDVDVTTANAEIGRWLHDIANARVHATTKAIPEQRLVEERRHLMPLPRTYPVRSVGLQLEPRSRARMRALVIPPQHPLSVYDALIPEAPA